MEELVSTGENALSALGSGFSVDEGRSGMDQTPFGYVKSFPFFMRTDNGRFEIIDNATDEVVWSGKSEIKDAIVYYGHQVTRLRSGDISGFPEEEWGEDEKKVLAIAYSAKSRGTFDSAGVGEYLDSKDREFQKKLKRFYCFLVAPNLPTGWGVIAASVGISATKSFNAFRLECDRISNGGEPLNVPISFVLCDLGFVPAKNPNGKSYDRVTFSMCKTENGIPRFAFTSPDEYRSHPAGAQMLRKIRDTHEAAIHSTESYVPDEGVREVEAFETSASPVVSSDDDAPF